MQNWPHVHTYAHTSIFQTHAPSIAKLHMHKHTNKRTKQNLHRRASVARFLLWSLLTVCTFVCPYVCMALCLGSGEAQLPQLSTLALALKSDGPLLPGCPWTPCSPAHCSLGPRTLQMIYYPYRERERALGPNLSSPPSQSFSPSSLFTPSTLHANPITFSLSQKEKSTSRVPSCLFILSWTHLFFIGIFPSYLCCSSPFSFGLLPLENTRIAYS